ncbi:MAG TPA: N-acetylmuramoyl-L-alanine amidase, partial [Thermoanaerobaculia bacterium]|nr:N-acetylmuramoyl-L-alanine amidase [Thermoanaerobaculia bacterium]
GYRVVEKDRLEQTRDHSVLTNPRYEMENPIIGVNLRWYLANSILRRMVAERAEAEKVVFLSIHADSLHPSLRGAMAYIPGESHVQGTYEKKAEVYLARAEVRESPAVTLTREEALVAEGLSAELAGSIIGAFQRNELKTHPFQPVRRHVVREGREWVPAVIRYNKVPSRLLLEICNIGNQEDRKLLVTRSWRQKAAHSIYEGIVGFFEQKRAEPAAAGVVAAAGR